MTRLGWRHEGAADRLVTLFVQKQAAANGLRNDELPHARGKLERMMPIYRPGLFGRDAALRAKQRLEQRMERRSKRRLAKHLLERSLRWRRTVLKIMAAGMAVTGAGLLLFGELAVAAVL
jgi:hypothetical protein